MQTSKHAYRGKQKAVIYCRVSGKKQTTEGSGLDSQEYRCRQHADAQGYEVVRVFPDDVSGGGDFTKRKGMVALLKFLDAHPNENFVVIFDDLKRYARDAEFHLKLRRLMAERGAIRECLNYKFDDSEEGLFLETIVAAQGELERLQMRRQNRQKSMARIEQGYWVFRAPVGYRYEKCSSGGKELVIDEPLASVVREALEGFASGHFASQTELRRFLEHHPHYPKDMPNGGIRPQTIVRLLGKVVYAGYVEAPKWGVSPRKGNHQAIISYETYIKIQERLIAGVYAPARKDTAEDFPLRGAVACGCCNTILTAGWSKGKYTNYAYYRCRKKGCEMYGKSIQKKAIEGDFEELLSELRPSPELRKIAPIMFEDCWRQLSAQDDELHDSYKKQIRSIEDDIDTLVQRTVQASNPRVIAAYEKNIESLEIDRLVLQEKMENPAKSRHTFSQLFELSMKFLSNPCKIWTSGRLELQRLVLKLVFLEPIPYCRESGFLNPKISLPINALGGGLMLGLQNGAVRED